MKKWIGCLLAFIIFFTPIFASAIERLTVDNRGYRVYRCGSAGRGAKIKIKELRGERFQVISKPFTGILYLPSATATQKRCTGLEGAVQVLCDRCPWPTGETRIERRKRQLGLVDAE